MKIKTFTLILIGLFFIAGQSIAQTVSISCQSPTTACSYALPNGEGHTYVASISSMGTCGNGSTCHFKWEVTNGKITANNSTTYEGDGVTNIIVNWDNVSGTGTVKVTTSNSAVCKNCPASTATRSIPIRNLGAVGNIKINGTAYSGTGSTPCGSSNITVSVDPVTNADTYFWTVPAGWNKTGSGNSITVTPTAGTGGAISVIASRSDVVGLTSSKTLHVNRPLPQLGSIMPNSGIVFCSGGNTQLASASGINAEAFLWTPFNGVTINNSSSPVISNSSVTVGGTSNGHYQVQAYSYTCGNVASTNVQNNGVRVGALTGIFFSNVANGTNSNGYFCSSHYGDRFEIAADNGTTTSEYDVRFLSWPSLNVIHTQTSGPIFNSNYTFPGGFSGYIVAEIKDHTCPGGDWYGGEIEVVDCTGSYYINSVYPNPASEELTIEYRNAAKNESLPESVKLYNEQSGQLILTVPVQDIYKQKGFIGGNKTKINTSTLKSGKYFLHVVPNAKSKEKAEKIQVIIK